jgi:hypothetical protein
MYSHSPVNETPHSMRQPIPKPKVADFAEESESVEEDEGENTSDGSDSD